MQTLYFIYADMKCLWKSLESFLLILLFWHTHYLVKIYTRFLIAQ